ncbi:hypothetical protein NW767_002262 [Fusarium falciforme]|nr:hypothetical protein NW767_002262 [Fusarium falciforme]
MALEDPLHPCKILSQIDLLPSPFLGFLASISNYVAHNTSLFPRAATKAGTLKGAHSQATTNRITLKISSLPRVTVGQEIHMPPLADRKLG